MKVKTTIMAGLIITCSAVLHAQEVYANHPQAEATGLSHPDGNDPWIELQNIGQKNVTVAIEVPVVYRMCCRTNGLLHHASTDQNWTERTSVSELVKIPAMRIDYQLMPLSNEKEIFAVTDASNGNLPIQAADTEVSLFDHFSGNDIFDWMLKPIDTNKAPKVAAGTKKPAQIIVIESVKDSNVASTDHIQIPEYGPDMISSQHAWYEWINPELFLVKWAEYWFSETDQDNVTSVVLVQFSF